MQRIYPRWKAKTSGGRLYVDNQGGFSSYLQSLNGKELEVIVKPKVKVRSRKEEKYFHAVVVRMVAEAMSIEDESAKEFLRRLFLTVEERSADGKYRYTRVLSTTDLDDKGYREFWEKCIRWAILPTKPSGLSLDSGLELYIPYPNECDWDDGLIHSYGVAK